MCPSRTASSPTPRDIERIIPTRRDDIQQKGGKVILMAHFGRPKGQVVPEMSLEIIAPAVADVLGFAV